MIDWPPSIEKMLRQRTTLRQLTVDELLYLRYNDKFTTAPEFWAINEEIVRRMKGEDA